MGGYKSWGGGWEEVGMLEWKGLLGRLGPECHSCGVKRGLGPNPWGWKTCGDPRRKVLGWGCCEGLLGPQRVGAEHEL